MPETYKSNFVVVSQEMPLEESSPSSHSVTDLLPSLCRHLLLGGSTEQAFSSSYTDTVLDVIRVHGTSIKASIMESPRERQEKHRGLLALIDVVHEHLPTK